MNKHLVIKSISKGFVIWRYQRGNQKICFQYSTFIPQTFFSKCDLNVHFTVYVGFFFFILFLRSIALRNISITAIVFIHYWRRHLMFMLHVYTYNYSSQNGFFPHHCFYDVLLWHCWHIFCHLVFENVVRSGKWTNTFENCT